MGALSLCQEMSNGEAFIVTGLIPRLARGFNGDGMGTEERELELELIAGWLTYPPFGRRSCMTRYGNESSGVIAAVDRCPFTTELGKGITQLLVHRKLGWTFKCESPSA